MSQLEIWVVSWATDRNGRCSRIDPSWADITGQSADHAHGDGWLKLIHESDRGPVYSQMQHACATGRAFRSKVRLRRIEGDFHWVMILGAPQRDERGVFCGHLGSIAEFDDCVDNALYNLEQKKAEEALRISEQRHRTLIDATSTVTWTLAPSGLAVDPQPDWTELTGQSTEELLGNGWTAVLHPDDVEPTLKEWQRCVNEQVAYTGVYRLFRKDGSLRWMSVVGVPLRGADGKIVEWCGMNIDITERREADEALRASQDDLARAQRMEAIGRLAGGIAHDFNNLLTIVAGNLKLAEWRIDDGKAKGQIRKAVEAVRLGGALTRRLLSFAGRSVLASKIVNLDDQVVEVVDMLRQTLGELIRLEMQLHSSPWRIRVDPGEIESAIVNIALNARDAMPAGGKLTIITSKQTLSNALASMLGVSAGEFICLTMTDEGSGMTPEVAGKATEPFFTTKADSDRSGLGLSSVYGFVVRSNAGFNISSEIGVGTSISIYLPRAFERDEPKMPDSNGLKRGAGDLVLVVDDNEFVREVTDALLTTLGYEVMIARNGPEAVRMMTSANAIKVVFSDVIMPGGMSGYDVADWVKANRPDVKILLTSGYIDANAESGRAYDVTILGKPYTPEQLANTMRQLLGD